jgi:hypothetical protein
LSACHDQLLLTVMPDHKSQRNATGCGCAETLTSVKKQPAFQSHDRDASMQAVLIDLKVFNQNSTNMRVTTMGCGQHIVSRRKSLNLTTVKAGIRGKRYWL